MMSYPVCSLPVVAPPLPAGGLPLEPLLVLPVALTVSRWKESSFRFVINLGRGPIFPTGLNMCPAKPHSSHHKTYLYNFDLLKPDLL